MTNVVITDYLGLTPQGEFSAPAMPYMTVLRKSQGWYVPAGATGYTFRYDVGMLRPSQSGVLTLVVRLASPPIPYTVTLSNNRAIAVDDGTQGFDTNSSNQSPSLSSPIQGPDLAISNVQISPGPQAVGVPFVVTATVTNRGLNDVVTWQHVISPTDSTNNWLSVDSISSRQLLHNPARQPDRMITRAGIVVQRPRHVTNVKTICIPSTARTILR